jgi:N-acetylglutamate synthase
VDAADIDSLERAAVAGVAPSQVLEIDGWLVALDAGAIRRAASAVPLQHDLDADAVNAIEAAYRTEGLKPAFRIAEVAGLRAVRDALARRRYASEQPTVVKVGDVDRLARFRDAPADILARPDEAWGLVFLGEGFDPVDGASRVASLSRSPDALYGVVRQGERTVAVGVVTFGHGWAGIHGMRTAQDCRGRGYAAQILTAFGRAAAERGFKRVYLQVTEENPARRLYRKAGFEAAWTYRYWS